MSHETAPITKILHVYRSIDVSDGAQYAVVMAQLSNNAIVEVSIRAEAAARLSALIAQVGERCGWRLPTALINEDEPQSDGGIRPVKRAG